MNMQIYRPNTKLSYQISNSLRFYLTWLHIWVIIMINRRKRREKFYPCKFPSLISSLCCKRNRYKIKMHKRYFTCLFLLKTHPSIESLTFWLISREVLFSMFIHYSYIIVDCYNIQFKFSLCKMNSVLK